MKQYSVKKLAQLAGVSVRTLHHYDRLGLLRPSVRTEARYRLYGENELLRLQQILFYKELDFSLDEIARLLAVPDFDVRTALAEHRRALQARQRRIAVLLTTIDRTIAKLNGEHVMLTDEQLYEGFLNGQEYRREAVVTYGAETVDESETKLRRLGKAGFEQLKAEQQAIFQTLAGLAGQEPASPAVQAQITRHYANIRAFWGESVCRSKNMVEAYKGLANLYVDDPRYTAQNGQTNPAYADFLRRAMHHFADTQLTT